MSNRQPHEYAAVHKAADYYEPLIRARIVRALKSVRKSVSINDLAMAMGNAKQAASLLPRKTIENALAPAAKVVHDARMQGGKIGAAKVRAL